MSKSIPNKAQLSDRELLAFYRKMLDIRVFEETVQTLFQEGHIYGTMHLCSGQEATAVGSAGLLRKEDWITSTHRNHGHCIAKGTSVHSMLAEMLGKKTGTNLGKGGSMHIADLEYGNLGSNGIVGAGFPIAAGAALTAQMQGTDQVVLCFGGDGATNEGSFHEALNLASIWRLPVVYFIENNQYGMSTRIQDTVNIKNISERATAYGIKGVTIDGNDLLAVINATWEAIEAARAGQGPTLIEAKTYRFSGHSKSDKREYRSIYEEQLWQRSLDPLERTAKLFLANGLFTKDEMEKMKFESQNEINQIVEKVKAEPIPNIEDLWKHVYAE